MLKIVRGGKGYKKYRWQRFGATKVQDLQLDTTYAPTNYLEGVQGGKKPSLLFCLTTDINDNSDCWTILVL